MRIVFDTASFVTAVRSSGGAAGEILRQILRSQIVPLMDYKLAMEYRAVALRPEHVSASGLSAAEIVEIIEAVESVAKPVRVMMQVRPLSTDPNDDMVLELAISGNADLIVTMNKKHFRVAAKRWAIPVLTPAELLERSRRGSHGR